MDKLLEICGGEKSDPLVCTRTYTYNAYINAVGNILRYDGPDPHRPYHHSHRYDLLAGDSRGSIEKVDDDAWPHLSEVVEEVMYWYWEHVGEIEEFVQRKRGRHA